ncbi:MAG: hypothetical protein ABI613_03250 [Gemmatimonadota bacterium]
MTGNAFDSERDPELGALLREYLEPSHHAAFVQQVLGRIRATDSSWEVLSRWARPSVAALIAFFMGAAVWFALAGNSETPATLSDAVRPGDAPAPLFSRVQPDNELVLEVVLER